MVRIRIGDVFEMTLTDGRRAFGQYVYKDKMGPIVRIFDLIVAPNEQMQLESLMDRGLLFPPVITGLFAAVRTGLWKIIGHLPTGDFQYQKFVSSFRYPAVGIHSPWYLWDGKQSVPIGYELPEIYQSLERLIVWEPRNLANRIETGSNPYAC